MKSIQTIHYKGAVTAEEYYGSVTLRNFNDLDFLVRRDDLVAMVELLESEGYRNSEKLTRAEFDDYVSEFKEFLFTRGEISLEPRVGDAYSAKQTGASVNWSGAAFALGTVDGFDAVSGAIVALPEVNDSTLALLATAVHGNQTNQTFVVTYTDGTTSSFTQSMSDWHTPQNYAGESNARIMLYRLTATGASDNRTFVLYGYSFAINSAKTLKSITLRGNRNVVVLAIDLSPWGGFEPV